MSERDPAACYWSHDDDDGDLWEGSCGVAWSLTDGTPSEHRMGYCPRCGKPLHEARRDEQSEVAAQATPGAPALSDADVLERAAAVLRSHGKPETAKTVEIIRSDLLRAAPPAPDWIERMAHDAYSTPVGVSGIAHLAAYLRARLEPVEEILADASTCAAFTTHSRMMCKRALSILRGEVRL